MSEPVFVVAKIHSPSCYHEKALLDTIIAFILSMLYRLFKDRAHAKLYLSMWYRLFKDKAHAKLSFINVVSAR